MSCPPRCAPADHAACACPRRTTARAHPRTHASSWSTLKNRGRSARGPPRHTASCWRTTTTPPTSCTGGRKMHVAVSPAVARGDAGGRARGALNEALNVVEAGEVRARRRGGARQGVDRARPGLVNVAHADEERVCRLAGSIPPGSLRVGDALLLEARSGLPVRAHPPKAEVADLVLEEVPDISYEDIGGLRGQIEAIRDSVELPYLHPDLFREHQLRRRRVCCSTGRPAAARR
jgi:proteasome-associated ATPase